VILCNCKCDCKKANYGAIHLSGDEIPSIDELVERAREVLTWANGFYFNTECAGPNVKKYFTENIATIICDVARRINAT
jgi:hypothetical protein